MDILNKKLIAKLESQVDSALNRADELEEIIRNHDDLALELRIVKMLLNDDEAVLELLDADKKIKSAKRADSISCETALMDMRHREQMGRFSESLASAAGSGIQQAQQMASQAGFYSALGLQGLLTRG